MEQENSLIDIPRKSARPDYFEARQIHVPIRKKEFHPLQFVLRCASIKLPPGQVNRCILHTILCNIRKSRKEVTFADRFPVCRHVDAVALDATADLHNIVDSLK